MEQDPDQYDSAIDVDSDDDESAASLDDAFREREYRYGRGYPVMYQSPYPWPIDKVYGIDIVCMQEEWVPPNCEFYVEDIMRLAWKNDYKNINFIHVGEIGGDPKLLQAILDGAFTCCAPDGMIELWDCTLHLQDPQGISGLHGYVYKLREAYQRDGRDVDLAYAYPEELEMHGFVHVVQHVYSIPLHRAHPDSIQGDIVENWSAGLEASALELMHTHLGMNINEILLECVAARAALREGIHGHLRIHVVHGRKPKLHGR
ncbi:hypothetical protein CNMCM5793_003678 [Aspergillus hiratsukae]|uniref:Uncharacterized protein n=1 Tax=Aspergillus hiratsukae TaxID=1194566 RepID=A0A8H6PEB0_9EURO|nr:hypothetical protein CNMCM5793_003678 [Aspergillus hiratsukae]KAF7174366.1 hypothetical protein CNMCM6106_008622 [Aspergillus hiratsukae]